ncbi:MAG: fold metallo-hydrolase, partial [Citricoccus sp.]|nr:fold metallo-hydrolase [Citricoccus sp. WCRC_4]
MDRPRPGPAGGPGPFRPLRNAVALLAHLHSDLCNIIGTDLQNGLPAPDPVLQVFGPGDRGAPPVDDKGEQIPAEKVVTPANPTPGTRVTVESTTKTFASRSDAENGSATRTPGIGSPPNDPAL